MDYNFSLPRLAILLAALTLFWLLDGFSFPDVPRGGVIDPTRVKKAWMYCLMLYVLGAVAISVVDHYVGNIDRTNIRSVYIIIGICAMLGSILWLRGIQASLAPVAQ